MSEQSSQERISQKLSSGSEPSKDKSNKAIRIAIAVSIVVLVVIGLLIFFKKGKADDRNVVVTPDNVDETLAQIADSKAQAGTYEVTMNTTWEFENGGSASTNAYVENSVANSNDVYFDLVRSDTNETIYTSPTIPLGNHLENIVLDTPLEKGSYDCVLTYFLLDEEGKPISKLNIQVTINVKN